MCSSSIKASLFALTLVLSPMTGAQAAELKVMAGGSMTASLQALAPQFESKAGHNTGSYHKPRHDCPPIVEGLRSSTNVRFQLGSQLVAANV